jgi:inosose dehydratase
MERTSRRALLVQLAAQTVATSATHPADKIGLAFGLYGMKSIATADALRLCAAIGYDGVELPLMPGWKADPALLGRAGRAELRKLLAGLGLVVPAVMENLPYSPDPERRRVNLERLKLAAEFGHDVSPAKLPVIDTILGAKASQWDEMKGRLVDEMHRWARTGQELQTVIGMKPHAANAVNTPERALWILKQVGSPWLRIVYDYSHFFLEGLSLAATLKQLLPVAPFISVKDSRGSDEKHEFLLPGEGRTDYIEYFRILKAARYRGFVSVEVSSMIHNRPGYDPERTARKCYAFLAPLFARAGVGQAPDLPR